MRILVCSVDAFPRMGGISAMAHHLSNALVRLGNEVVFLGPHGSYVPAGYLREYVLVEDLQSNVSHRSGSAGLVQDARIRVLTKTIIARYAPERVLLVHPFYYGVGVLDATREPAVPVSVCLHGYELRSQLREYNGPEHHADVVQQRRIGSLGERLFYAIGMCDEILTNSRYTASLLDFLEVKPLVRETGCGIPMDDLRRELEQTHCYSVSERQARRRALGLPQGTCLGYVGRLVPAKRVDRILEFCKDCSGLAGVIIGGGPQEDQLRACVQQWGLQAQVVLVGQVSEEKKWELLRAVDFLCLLSEPDDATGAAEGFGLALLEGAAAGAVPVSSGTAGMAEVVSDGTTGLVLPPGAPAAADRLLRVGSAEQNMARLNESARTQLREKFTWNAVAERILGGW